MFMNDPDFDDEFQPSPGFEYGHAFPSPDSKQKQERDDGHGMGTPQNSRARALAQQREIQMKKRQSNLLSGGMVRSSMDSVGNGSPFRQSTNSQLTPAVAGQFSAPKVIHTQDSPEKDSEFTKKSRSSANMPAPTSAVSRYAKREKFSDDEDDERAAEASRRAEARRTADRGGDRDRDRDRDYGRDRGDREGRSGGGNNNNNSSYNNGGGGGRRTGEGRAGSRRRDDDDDEDDMDYDYNRRGNNNNNASGYANNSQNTGMGNSSRGRNQRDDDHAPSSSSGYRSQNNNSRNGNGNGDEGSYGDNRGQSQSQSQGKWAGATGGRDVNNGYPATTSSSDNNRDSSGGNNNRYRGAAEVAVVTAAPQQASAVQARNQLQSQQQVPLTIVSPDLRDMRAFLCSPLPRNNGTLQCYIRRNKSGTHKLFPIYSLYLKEGDVFLMASKKRPKNKTSNYLISMDQNDLNRTGRGYLGKLRSNFVGTEFQVFDDGVNPKDCDADEAANSNGSVRCEMGSVMYAANVLGSRGPRKMQVALPGLDERGHILQWKDNGGGNTDSSNTNSSNQQEGSGEDILTRMKDRNLRDLNYLINKPPRWNEQVGAYVLNFNGRVTMASVKNFQLVDPDEQNAVVLQFGRVGKDEFTMDLQHPISPFQAFAVTLSSFDSKIACD